MKRILAILAVLSLMVAVPAFAQPPRGPDIDLNVSLQVNGAGAWSDASQSGAVAGTYNQGANLILDSKGAPIGEVMGTEVNLSQGSQSAASAGAVAGNLQIRVDIDPSAQGAGAYATSGTEQGQFAGGSMLATEGTGSVNLDLYSTMVATKIDCFSLSKNSATQISVTKTEEGSCSLDVDKLSFKRSDLDVNTDLDVDAGRRGFDVSTSLDVDKSCVSGLFLDVDSAYGSKETFDLTKTSSFNVKGSSFEYCNFESHRGATLSWAGNGVMGATAAGATQCGYTQTGAFAGAGGVQFNIGR